MRKSARTDKLSASKTAVPKTGLSKTTLSKKPAGNPAKVTIHKLSTAVLGLDTEMSTGIPHRTGPRRAQENEAAPEPKASM
jgi:hypothetical protein